MPDRLFGGIGGTFGGNPLACTMFEPPVGNILGFITIEDGIRYFAKADYAGLAEALGAWAVHPDRTPDRKAIAAHSRAEIAAALGVS